MDTQKRIIKFRGIYVDTGEWVYGDLLHYGADTVIFDSNVTNTYYQVKPETVGQYTGLHDNTKWSALTEKERNEWVQIEGNFPSEWKGKKIFEGDDVELNCLTEPVRGEGTYWKKEKLTVEFTGQSFKPDRLKESVVVGNSHGTRSL